MKIASSEARIEAAVWLQVFSEWKQRRAAKEQKYVALILSAWGVKAHG